MVEQVPMTLRGKEKLEVELKHLMSVERPAVIQAIDEARQLGDLSENAEYHAAKEKQSFVEGRIQEINGKLVAANVIDPKSIQSDRIVFGATVVLKDEDGEEKTYSIVGEDEAEIKDGLISIHSPIAKAMIGKEVGDEVNVKAPKGTITYEVINVTYG